jgi:hypothetical protein
MPYVGDDYLTVKEYKGLRQKWREAQTSTPWKAWATWYLSPAGKRDRDATERARQAEDRNQRAVAASIHAQRQAMDEETTEPAVLSALHAQANERDIETGNYSMGALAAQRQLVAMGAQPRAGRVGVITMARSSRSPGPRPQPATATQGGPASPERASHLGDRGL